jgi:hypothetical protein
MPADHADGTDLDHQQGGNREAVGAKGQVHRKVLKVRGPAESG